MLEAAVFGGFQIAGIGRPSPRDLGNLIAEETGKWGKDDPNNQHQARIAEGL
jgi:hypothetical protein